MSPSEPNNRYRAPLKGELEDGRESESPKKLPIWVNVGIAVFCAFYLINPTAGIIEFIPDNLPLVGNRLLVTACW